jgi:hypothetical protein
VIQHSQNFVPPILRNALIAASVMLSSRRPAFRKAVVFPAPDGPMTAYQGRPCQFA